MSPVSEGACCDSSCTVRNTEHKANEILEALNSKENSWQYIL
jgi:hypothetical protein